MPKVTHHNGMSIPECHLMLERLLAADVDRLILYGPPGTGKTYSAMTLATGGRPTFRLVCNEDMSIADVSGTYMPNEKGGFSWIDGVATKAWRTGGRLVIDEIDKASGDVFAMLLAYTDSVASASLDLLTGETIRPAAGFSAVMTTNIESPSELPVALRDRFPLAVCIDKAHPQALDSLMPELRPIALDMIGSPETSRYTSLRAFYGFQHLISHGFELNEAALLVFDAVTAARIIDALKIALLSGAVTVSVTKSETVSSETVDTSNIDFEL